MNLAACQAALEGVGGGVGASLRGVDCAASAMAQDAFGRLFGSGGALVPALTILLTLYIAFFAFALITGRSRIGISSLTPRMVTLGMVLTFATSWIAYQSVVWNLATGAPDQIAGILIGTEGSATQVFADKIDVVFGALIQATSGVGGEASQVPQSTFSPTGLLWLGGMLLLLGTVGVLVTAKIALAVLLAIGPVFVVLALFQGTRGLFAGWIKGVVLLAVAPLFAVLGGSLMLELAVPVLSALTAMPGQIDPRAAMGFFMIGAVHAALMVLVMKVAGTMVAGWSVFGLAGGNASAGRDGSSSARHSTASPSVARVESASAPGLAPSRQIRIAGAAPIAANDSAPSTTIRRETVISGGASSHSFGAQANQSAASRTRGIGSRFRSAPSRPTEMLK